MGGTLDPVHNGHIEVALAAKRLLKLDRVMLLPAGDPPHKAHPTLKRDRLNMARIAAEGAEGLFVSDIEIARVCAALYRAFAHPAAVLHKRKQLPSQPQQHEAAQQRQ